MFVDTHAHLTSSLESDVSEDLLSRAYAAGVHTIINICTDESSLIKGDALRQKSRQVEILNVASTTPHDVAKDGEHFFPIVEQYAKEKKLLAIGETGLDYYYLHSPKELQKLYLQKYLDLTYKHQLPVVFHCRDAFDDLYSIFDEKNTKAPIQGILHCFTGTEKEAKEGLDRGFFISFSGIITFAKSTSLRDVVKYVPLDRILIETDSPYLAPEPHRGKKNEPSFIIHTAELIALLKGVSIDELAHQTKKNAEKAFSFHSKGDT